MQLPKDYESKMTLKETEQAIKEIKDCFEQALASTINVTRVSAPLFVECKTGINDDLNGVEQPVTFTTQAKQQLEVVQSLAKWKRAALARYGFCVGEGLYTDMNAIRKDEIHSHIHSIYVDQWDWEVVIDPAHRNLETLQAYATKIFHALQTCEVHILSKYPHWTPRLPETLYFISSQELYERFPHLSAKQREDAITREFKAVFVIGIGDVLTNGLPHDLRAPDYDDWNLNGDLLVYDPLYDQALELSSMGIRVDANILQAQLTASHAQERLAYPYHQALLKQQLPQTIGGGIGQSRMCMYFLRKAHIGEVQASVWPSAVKEACAAAGIILL
ncbi:MAG: aspartate--ammonia ligase [Erysipelotrichaceae bacterium]